MYFLPCLSVISAARDEYAARSSYAGRILQTIEPTLEGILKDFVRMQVQSINDCKMNMRHAFVAPYFAKFPLFCDRVCRRAGDPQPHVQWGRGCGGGFHRGWGMREGGGCLCRGCLDIRAPVSWRKVPLGVEHADCLDDPTK